MARGIWENSLMKIFLTRSFLGPIFRPFLYSAEEYVHYTFLEEITMLTQEIVKISNLEKRGLAYYWLIEVPRSLFEELFINNAENQRKCQIFYDSKVRDGSGIAYLTQGYILAIMPCISQKDESFHLRISPSISELEQIILAVYGAENRISYYQHYFQQLLTDFRAEETNEAVVRCYIEKMIDHVTDISAFPRESNQQWKIHQEALNYCLWKLQNTKSSWSDMVRRLKEIRGGPALYVSKEKANY